MTTLLIDFAHIFCNQWYGNQSTARSETVRVIAEAAEKYPRTIVCLDSGGKTFRHEIHPEYKANRAEKDPAMIAELKATVADLDVAGFLLASAPGFEADDVIATLATKATGDDIVIGSSDKDLMQLVGSHVLMLSTRDGRTIDNHAVHEKFGVWPCQMLDYLCLVGDSSDNVPGIRGIGAKRAADLLSRFGSVDGIYEALRTATLSVGTPAIATALSNGWETILLARKLIALRTDAPVEFSAVEEKQHEQSKEEKAVETATTQNRKPEPKPVAKAGGLANVKRGKIATSWRFLIFGPEGSGKSTLASGAPSPIWLDVEDGSGRLDVARYMFRDDANGHVPRTYAEILAAINELATVDHEYKTVVIDSIDRVETLLWAHLVAESNAKGTNYESPEDFGFGKGYVAALALWKDLCKRLDALRAKNINVILLAHAQVKLFKSPTSEDYDRYMLRCNDKAAGYLKEWCDVVGFLAYDDAVVKGKGFSRSKGIGNADRILRTSRTAAYDAKSRLPLPEEIKIDIGNPWKPFADAINAFEALTPETLLLGIEAELIRIGDNDLTDKVRAACAPVVKDTAALSRFLQSLKSREAKQIETTQAA